MHFPILSFKFICHDSRFSFLTQYYIMLRLPSQTPSTEWNSNWKDIQPALRKVRRSMASLRTSSLKVMRVSQLDSDILDVELVDILKEQLWNAFSLFKVLLKPYYLERK